MKSSANQPPASESHLNNYNHNKMLTSAKLTNLQNVDNQTQTNEMLYKNPAQLNDYTITEKVNNVDETKHGEIEDKQFDPVWAAPDVVDSGSQPEIVGSLPNKPDSLAPNQEDTGTMSRADTASTSLANASNTSLAGSTAATLSDVISPERGTGSDVTSPERGQNITRSLRSIPSAYERISLNRDMFMSETNTETTDSGFIGALDDGFMSSVEYVTPRTDKEQQLLPSSDTSQSDIAESVSDNRETTPDIQSTENTTEDEGQDPYNVQPKSDDIIYRHAIPTQHEVHGYTDTFDPIPERPGTSSSYTPDNKSIEEMPVDTAENANSLPISIGGVTTVDVKVEKSPQKGPIITTIPLETSSESDSENRPPLSDKDLSPSPNAPNMQSNMHGLSNSQSSNMKKAAVGVSDIVMHSDMEKMNNTSDIMCNGLPSEDEEDFDMKF